MSIRDFAAKFVEAEDAAFQKGDFSALSRIEHPNVVMHMGPPFGDMFGHEAHKQYIMGARKASNDFKQDWKFLAGNEDLFALSYRATGRFAADMPGLPPTAGKSFDNDYLFVIRVQNQRVAEVWAKGTMAFT